MRLVLLIASKVDDVLLFGGGYWEFAQGMRVESNAKVREEIDNVGEIVSVW